MDESQQEVNEDFFLFNNHQLLFYNVAVTIGNGQISNVLPTLETKRKEDADVKSSH